MALEQLQFLEQQMSQLDQEMANLLSKHQDAVERLAEVPGRGVDSAQLRKATATCGAYSIKLRTPQPGPKEASSRSCIAARSPPGTQSSQWGHRPSTVSTDLVDPAPRSSLRRTGPRRHQAVKAKAHGENDPATPKPRLSDRTTESSTQPSTSAAIVIFEPLPSAFCPPLLN